MQIEPSKDKFAPCQLLTSFVRRPTEVHDALPAIKTAGLWCGHVALPTALNLCRFRIDRLDPRGRLGIFTRIDMSHTCVHKMPGEGRVHSTTRNPWDCEN